MWFVLAVGRAVKYLALCTEGKNELCIRHSRWLDPDGEIVWEKKRSSFFIYCIYMAEKTS